MEQQTLRKSYAQSLAKSIMNEATRDNGESELNQIKQIKQRETIENILESSSEKLSAIDVSDCSSIEMDKKWEMEKEEMMNSLNNAQKTLQSLQTEEQNEGMELNKFRALMAQKMSIKQEGLEKKEILQMQLKNEQHRNGKMNDEVTAVYEQKQQMLSESHMQYTVYIFPLNDIDANSALFKRSFKKLKEKCNNMLQQNNP